MDQYGFVYVLDSGNARVQKWSQGARYGSTVLSATLSSPMGMSINAYGNLFIADTSNHRIQSFSVYCRKFA